MRIVARVILAVFASVLTLVALVLTGAHGIAGSSAAAASTVKSALADEKVITVLSGRLLERVLKDADAKSKPRLMAGKPKLVEAVSSAISSQKNELGAIAEVAFNAMVNAETVNLDLTTEFKALSQALHAADAQIPADALSSKTARITLDGKTKGETVRTVVRILGLWWIAALAALLFLAGFALLSRKTRLQRLRAPGIVVAAVATVWLVGIAVLKSTLVATAGDQSDVISAIAPHALSPLRVVAIIALLLGLVAVALSVVHRFQPRASSHTGDNTSVGQEQAEAIAVD